MLKKTKSDDYKEEAMKYFSKKILQAKENFNNLKEIYIKYKLDFNFNNFFYLRTTPTCGNIDYYISYESFNREKHNYEYMEKVNQISRDLNSNCNEVKTQFSLYCLFPVIKHHEEYFPFKIFDLKNENEFTINHTKGEIIIFNFWSSNKELNLNDILKKKNKIIFRD